MPSPAPTSADALADWLRRAADCDAATPVDVLWRQLQRGLELLDGELAAHQPAPTELLSALLKLILEPLLGDDAQRHAERHAQLQPLLATDLAAEEYKASMLDEQLADADISAERAAASEALAHRLQMRLWFLHLVALGLDGNPPQPYDDLVTYLDALRAELIHDPLPQAAPLLHQLDDIGLRVLTEQGQRCASDATTLAAADTGSGQQALQLLQAQQHNRRLHTRLLDGLGRAELATNTTDSAPAAATAAAARATLGALEQAQAGLMDATIERVDALSDAEASQWLTRHAPVIADLAADTLSDIPDRDLQTQPTVLKQSYRLARRFRTGLLQTRRKTLKSSYKQVRNVERQLRAEWVEAAISARMAQRFGPHFERRLDYGVLALVMAAIVILVVDLSGDLSRAQLHLVIWLDTAICAGLLGDFILRLKLAPDRADFLRRHWFTDLLPAIPFAGIGLWISSVTPEASGIVLLRLLRVVAVALRKARPLIQISRMFLFAARGMDRLVRRYRGLLNWDILFFEPKPMDPSQSLRLRSERLGHRLRTRSRQWRNALDAPAQTAIVERNLQLAARIGDALHPVDAPEPAVPAPPVARQIAVETVIDRLTHADPFELTATLGADFPRRLTRLAWVAALPPLRWLPLFNDVLKARDAAATDLEFATNLARRLGDRLQWLNDKVMLLSDVHGVITAPQFVDRIGSTLIESMRRPRNRLLMLGGGFIIVTLLVEVLPFDWLEATAAWLRRTLGWPIFILGAIAFGAVWFGTRLRKLAQTNTDFYTRVAEAKSINLLGDVKHAHATADQEVLARRVLRPEARIRGREANSQATPIGTGDAGNTSDTANDHFRALVLEVFGHDPLGIPGSLAERVYLLYRDYLRGAHFDRSNTHTTDHLLGSPALINLRRDVLQLSEAELQELETLDLRRSSALGGPSLWLRFVSHAITQRVGQLVEEYNRHAIPVQELGGGRYDADDHRRLERWLDYKQRGDNEQSEHDDIDHANRYTTSAFNALDFLSNDPDRDRAIRQRFGDTVLQQVRTDRRRLIREVFGIPALHQRAPGQRSFNPYALYQRFMSRGRVFLLPFALLRLLASAIGLGFSWFRATLNELRHPEQRLTRPRQQSFSDPRIALRKVHRMRKPVFLASTQLRARVDVEYLGLRLPGESQGSLEGSTVFEDLDMIGASAEERADYQQMATLEQQRIARLQRFLQRHELLGDALQRRLDADNSNGAGSNGLHRAEVVRAICTAYTGNYQGLRELISGPRELRQLVRAAVAAKGQHHRPGGIKRAIRRWTHRSPQARAEVRFHHWWQASGQAMLDSDGGPDDELKLADARRWVHNWWLADHRDIAQLIDTLSQQAGDPTKAALAVIERVIHDTGNWSEQLVTLRTVQALTILDIRSTTHIVRGLGQYDEDDDGSLEVRVNIL